MELASLMATLTAEGFTMGAVGCNAIEVKGPTHRLTPALRQALAEHKPTLLAMLAPQGALTLAKSGRPSSGKARLTLKRSPSPSVPMMTMVGGIALPRPTGES